MWLHVLVLMLEIELGACRRVRPWANILLVDLEPLHHPDNLT